MRDQQAQFWAVSGASLLLFMLIGSVYAGVPKKGDIPKGWSEIELVDNTPMVKPDQEQEKKGYLIFKRPSVEIVFSAVVPKENEIVSELSGFATPGECEPVTFCLRTLKELKGVGVTVTDLKNETGKVIEAGNIEVGSVRSFYRRAMENQKGYYDLPSIIEKRPAVDIPANISHRFWLTVHVPEDAAAGIYTGKISLVPTNAPATEIGLKFRILPFKLAEVPKDKMFGFCYQDDYQHPTRAYAFKDMREYGATTIWLGWVSCLKQDRNDSTFRTVEYDGEKLTKHFDGASWFEQCMEEYKKNKYPAPIIFGMGPHDVEAFALKYGAFGSEGFNKAYKAAVKAVSEYGKTKDWPEIYWVPMDEVGWGWGDNPSEQKRKCLILLKLLKEVGVKTAIDGAWENFMNEKEAYPLIDLLVPSGYLPFREKTADIHKQGKKVICYNFDESGYFPEAQRFAVGFLSWSRGSDGTGEWAYQNHSDPYDDINCFGWNFRYPPQGEEVGGPSTGFEGFREGIDDYRYLTTLGNTLAELKKSNSPEDKQLVAEIQQELDGIIASIKTTEPMGGLYNGDGKIFSWKSSKVDFKMRKHIFEGPLRIKNGWELGDYDRARWKVAQLIMRAKKLESEKTGEAGKKKAELSRGAPLILNKIALPAEIYSPITQRSIIKVPVVSPAPVIDGQLDDAVWKQALKLDGFYVKTGKDENFANKPAEQQTEVRVLCDEQNIYIGYKCAEKDMAGLKVKVYKNNDPETWRDDCAEIFIDPDFTGKNQVHLMVNVNGFRHVYASPVSLKMKSKASRGPDYWMLEMALPIKELKEKYGQRWGLNFARERQNRDEVLQDHEMSSWCSGVFGYNPEKFNIVSFARSFLMTTRLDSALLGENKAILTLANTESAKVDLSVQLSLKAGTEEVTFPPAKVVLQPGEEKKLEFPFTLLVAGDYRVTATITDNVTAKVVEELAYIVPLKEMLQLSMLGVRQYLNESKLQVEVDIMAAPATLKGSELKMDLKDSEDKIIRKEVILDPNEKAIYTLDTGGLPAGKYAVVMALVKAGKLLAQRRIPLDKIIGPLD